MKARRRGFMSMRDISEQSAPVTSPEAAAMAYVICRVPAAEAGGFKIIRKGDEMIFVSSDKNVRFQVEALADDLRAWLRSKGMESPRRILWPRN